MERRYTTRSIKEALRDTAGEPTDKGLAQDHGKGVFTARKYPVPGGAKHILGATVFDVQTWLVRKKLLAPEWMLRKLLDVGASKVLNDGGRPSTHQTYLDKETGYVATNGN